QNGVGMKAACQAAIMRAEIQTASPMPVESGRPRKNILGHGILQKGRRGEITSGGAAPCSSAGLPVERFGRLLPI
ncbi:MAG: hypothetical protein AAF205_12850, partial [Pseudomonadota bacterium]